MYFTAKYSILDLENISGIKTHTLRIWEKRYSLLKPQRTESNIRYYDNEQLKLLLNIVTLLNNGYKISRIAALQADEICKEVNRVTTTSSRYSNYVDVTIMSMITLNEPLFNKEIKSLINDVGFECVVKNVFIPVLERVGILWTTNSINPAQEHFISNLIRNEIISATGALPPVTAESAPTLLLLLPYPELHEISLLLQNYLLRKQGFKTVYLGYALPIENLKQVMELVKINGVVTMMVFNVDKNTIDSLIRNIKTITNDLPLFISGLALTNYTPPTDIKKIVANRDARIVLDQIKPLLIETSIAQ